MNLFARSAVFLLALNLPAWAQAQAPATDVYPSRPVRIITTTPPGGPSDLVARTISNGLSPVLGKPFLVESRPGGGTTIGTNFVAKAPPDGYTLLVGLMASIAIAPSIYKDLPYDPQRELVVIKTLISTPSVLSINPALPAKTLAEFIAYAKARPGQLAYSSPGVGVSNHLAVENLAWVTGLKLNHVPYKGSPAAVQAVMSGDVAATFDPLSTTFLHHRAGKIRSLAIAAPRRSPLLPDVPTMEEIGFKDAEVSPSWMALMAPAGTPQPILARLQSEVSAIMAKPETRERFESLGIDLFDMAPQMHADFLRSEIEKWAAYVKRANIQN